jgi:DNA-directed RNA polymerase subunit RPC12/RpoP
MRKQGNTYEYQVMRSLKRKTHLINLRGGACEICGYNKNLAALEFHHIDREQKESQLDSRTLSNSNMEWIMEEFEKCMVLCANCHRELHSPDLMIEDVYERIKNFDLERSNKWIKLAEPKKYNCSDCGCEISKWGTKCRECSHKSMRKVDRPEKSIIFEMVSVEGYSSVARKFNVSDNTVRKWLK